MFTGKFKAIAPGTVKITAKNKKTGKAVATKKFTVLQRASELNLAESYKELEVGETYKLEAEKVPSTSTDVVRFYSSKKSVATVGVSSGEIKAVAPERIAVSTNQIVLLQGGTGEISFTVYNTLEEEIVELAESKLTISSDYQWIKAGADGKVTITPGAFQEAGNYTFTVGYGDCQSEKITVAILQIVEIEDSNGEEKVPGNDDSYVEKVPDKEKKL